MDEQEQLAAFADKQAYDKAAAMIAEKMARAARGEPMTSQAEAPKRLTYEEAKAAGDVEAMIKAKTGYWDMMDAEAERKRLLENIDITQTVKELGSLDTELRLARAEYNEFRDSEALRIDQESEAAQRELIKNGHPRGNTVHVYLIAQYKQEKAQIDDSPKALEMARNIQKLKARKSALEEARERYMHENADVISQARRDRIRKEVEASGLLDADK